MPLPKLPQQGDAARLEQVASGLKQTGGTHGPTVQRTPAGRPPGTGVTPTPRATQQNILRPEHKQVFDELAKAEVERQRWAALAAESPTPWVLGMQNLAERTYQEVATKTYNVIPNSEF
jgi:hypothetical protein